MKISLIYSSWMTALLAAVFMTGMPLVAADNGTAPVAQSLISNGDFEATKDGNQPDGWQLKDGATWEKQEDNHFLRLKSAKPGAMVMVYRAVSLTPQIKALKLKYKVRYEGIKRGAQAWFDGRIMLNFKDANKNLVEPAPKPPTFVGTSAEWKEHSQQFKIPDGAVMLELMLTLFQAEAGQLDFDDIQLLPISAEIIEAAEAAALAKEAARIAALPKPKPQVAVPAPEKLPKELRVVGNQIRNSAGEVVWLQGLAVPSMEWSATGENILKSIEVGIKEWKANCIRLPVRENFWSGRGPYQKDGGMQYRQTVDDAVNLCASNGCYLVLDLHDFRAPEQKHAVFWKEAAERYKNHPAVLFELLNEPHDIPWDVWQKGGTVTDRKKAGGGVLDENKEVLKSFESIGMQKLVDVIREIGAKNIVIAGGLDWGYDLSGILKGYALDDRGGNGVVYSSHVYPWKGDWQGKFVDAAGKVPLFLGEVGADIEKLSFIPPERQEDPYTWVPDMLGLIQKHKLNWTAWCFHPKASPRALQDWNYTPTPFWGEFVKQALAGKQFELKKLR